MFVLAHPLHAHGRTNGLGHQRSIDGHVIGAVVSVTARAFGIDAADIGDGQLQTEREVIAERKDSLGMGPHRHLAVFEFGERA